MRAILKTRCGCTREMEIPYPPNRVIIVPMYKHPVVAAAPPDTPITIETRTFEMCHCNARGPVMAEAVYVER